MFRLIALLLLAVLCQDSFAACNCGSTSEASPCTGQSASQSVDGTTFTWGFTCGGGDCQCGTFREGSPWVRHPSAGNVSINSVSPDDAASGLQKNPGIGGISTRENKYQGLLTSAAEAPYQDSLDISNDLPYLAAPDNGVYIKAKKYTGGDCGYTSAVGSNCIDTYAALVVLDDFPPDNTLGTTTFRPGASGATKLFVTEADIDLAIWPRFSQITASTGYTGIASRWGSPYPDYFPGNNGDQGRRWTPHARGLLDYAAQRAQTNLIDTFGTMSTDSSSAKDDAIYALIQYGIELYSAFAQGTEWVGGAGQSQGRWHPVVIFGTVYDGASKTTIQNNISAATSGVSTGNTGSGVQFTDLYQVRPNVNGISIWGSKAGDDGCGSPYQNTGWYWRDYSAQVSNGAESKRTCGDPYGYIDGPGEPGSYYNSCCSSGVYISMALLQKIWPEFANIGNNPYMLQYAERVMNGAGWWTQGDQCATRDPRELSGCLPYSTSSTASTCAMSGGSPLYFTKTWGHDDANDGTCVTIAEATSAGHPSPAGRWQSKHLTGRPALQLDTPGTSYWDVLVPRTGNQISATGTITNDD